MTLAPEAPSHPSILSPAELAKQIERLRSSGKKIVFTNGCYDIIHPGHVDLLARAKALGDILVLGLNSDDSVRRLEKGDERPINTFSARAFVLAHLASVDFITEFTEDTPLELIKLLRPDILVKGGDWAPSAIVGADEVLSWGGEVYSLPLLEGFSTTRIVKKVLLPG